MKKVFQNSSEVIHLFAQRTQDEARCSNVYFDNRNEIFSYGRHYKLGEFLTNSEGKLAIMINDTGYSNTTAKHISQIDSATRQYKQFFVTECKEKLVKEELEDCHKSLISSRKPELYINRANHLYSKFTEFVTWKGAEHFTMLAEIKALWGIFNSPDLQEYMHAKKLELNEARKAAKLEDEKRVKEQLQKFYDYEIREIRHTEEDFIRISKDGEFVETSQGVKATVKEAKTLYNLIEHGKDIKGFRIAGYTVISINGCLKIGCHHINMDSVHRTGKKLNELILID